MIAQLLISGNHQIVLFQLAMFEENNKKKGVMEQQTLWETL